MNLNKNTLASALSALGKLVCRTAVDELYKAIQIEAEEGKLKLTSCNLIEKITFQTGFEGNDKFCCWVLFDEFHDAVRSGRNKTVDLTYNEAGSLQIADQSLKVLNGIQWPDFTTETEVKSCKLPEGIVSLFARSSQIIERNSARRILSGINLSSDGITATNGKELLNFDLPLDLSSDLTIPLPLALMQSKAKESGVLTYWLCGAAEYRFTIQIGAWSWTSKALSGIYPNWKQVIPEKKTLTCAVSFLPEQGQLLVNFLKNIPNSSNQNAVTLTAGNNNTLEIHASGQHTSITAEFTGNREKDLTLSKTILLRLLQEGHTKIEFGERHTPMTASGGSGRYIAMPLYPSNYEHNKNIQPQKEEIKMAHEETKTVSVPNRTIPPKQEQETNQNPLDDLSDAIEEFKLKLKASFDEVSSLARKVREAQILQKQKERDFIQAKRAIERIRMAI